MHIDCHRTQETTQSYEKNTKVYTAQAKTVTIFVLCIKETGYSVFRLQMFLVKEEWKRDGGAYLYHWQHYQMQSLRLTIFVVCVYILLSSQQMEKVALIRRLILSALFL